MRRRSCLPTISGVLLLAAACAHRPPALATTAEANGSTAPHLLGCGYTPPLKPWFADHRFYVEVTVQPDGTIEPGSARVRTSHLLNGTSTAAGRAEQLATTCVFDPALRDGQPVEARSTLDVAFN